MHTCVLGSKKCLFFGNFGVLCFLETPVLRFALLSYYRRTRIGSVPPHTAFPHDGIVLFQSNLLTEEFEKAHKS